MAKVIFEFDPNNPDEHDSLRNTFQADTLYLVIEDFKEYLRGAIKYHDGSNDLATLEKVSEDFYSLLNDRNII